MKNFINFVSVLIFIAPKFQPVDPKEVYHDLAYADVNCTDDIWSSICQVEKLVVLFSGVPARRPGYYADYDSTRDPTAQTAPPQTPPPQTKPQTAPPSVNATKPAGTNGTASTKPAIGNGTTSTGNSTTLGTTPAPTIAGNVTSNATGNGSTATTKATGTSQGQPVANGTEAVPNGNSTGSPGNSATAAPSVSAALIDHSNYQKPDRFIRRAQPKPRVVRQVDQGKYTVRSTRAPIDGKPKELLLIVNCNTTYLPDGLGTLFPNMLKFVVWFSGLRYLTPRNFDDMKSVREINFQDNWIENFPLQTFYNCRDLVTLNLSGNKIKMLPNELFPTNQKLENFIANRNQIQFLPEKLFQNNTELVYLNFNNNLIKVISIDFTLLKRLKKVLGLQNTCADFFMNKEVTAQKLNELVKANCSSKAGKNSS